MFCDILLLSVVLKKKLDCRTMISVESRCVKFTHVFTFPLTFKYKRPYKDITNMRETGSNSSLYKERLNDPKYHILSEKAISLSTLSWNNSSQGRGSNHSVPPTRNSYDSTSIKMRHTPRDYYQLLLDFPSSVSLEAFRMGRRETTDETLKSILRKALHKTKPGEKEVCINGERFDVCRMLELLRKMSYAKQKLFIQKLETQLIIKPKVVGVSEDEEPHYNKWWNKYLNPMPHIETAISYNVREGKPEFIEKCISTSLPTPELSNKFEAPNRVEMSRIPDKIFEEDPINYFKARKRLEAPYQPKAEPIQSFRNLTNKEVQIVQNMWSSIKRNSETLATTIIINCYRLKENIVKKRVSINKILKHRQLMKHGRIGMAFLSQVVNHLRKRDESNQLVHKAGMIHQKYNFSPSLYELIINAFLLTLIEVIYPRPTMDQVSAFRKFLTILFDIFHEGCHWNKR